MTEDLIYYNSRWRYALLTLGGLVFVTMGFTLLSVNLSGVALDPEQLLEYILKQSAAVPRSAGASSLSS